MVVKFLEAMIELCIEGNNGELELFRGATMPSSAASRQQVDSSSMTSYLHIRSGLVRLR